MKRAVLTPFLSCLLASFLYADHPATAFYVLRTEDLKKILPEKQNPKELDISKLPDVAVAQGHVQGDCSVYLKTKEHQYRIEATHDKKRLSFCLSMYSQQAQKSVFTCSGEVELPEDLHVPSLKLGWRKDDYVAVWYREDLLK